MYPCKVSLSEVPWIIRLRLSLILLSDFLHDQQSGHSAKRISAMQVMHFVAIPAVVLYNLLKARVRKTMDGLGELRNPLLARSLQAVAREIH